MYPEVFDAGDYFGIMQVEEVDEEEEGDEEMEEELKKKPNPGNEPCFKVIVTNENGLQASNPNSVFLIDHAWTYRVEHARQQLLHVPGLLHRMANLMGIDFHGEIPDEGSIEQVLQEMWKYNQTYKLSQGTAEERVPVWYIMDEFGSRIQHSDQPSFAAAPLFYMPQQMAYTVLWPLRDLETGDEVTRDYAYGETDRLVRKCVLLPWVPTEVLDVNCFTPEPSDEHYQAMLAENKEKLPIAINPPVYDKDKVFKYVSANKMLSYQ
ncbi:PREDICTED: tubulin--tyrosine ligase-like protein 12, partial [Eurypyga helias]|uniref:tubulin--tyrosine ligase-like protein 12 n=1 Tax=Eurypyga helias TaxID=54383 RepID=UPI0005286D39